MVTALLIIHLLIILAMIGLILVQRNEGGALGIGGGAGGLMTARGTANLLTRATGVLAACFFVMTVVLAGVFRNDKGERSIIDDESALGLLDNSRPETSNLPAIDHNAPENPSAGPKADSPVSSAAK